MPELLEAAAALEALESGRPISTRLDAQLASLLNLTSIGIGGARPKNVVEDDDGLWVAKFPAQSDRWNNASVEAAMLSLASPIGREWEHELRRQGGSRADADSIRHAFNYPGFEYKASEVSPA